VDRDSDVSSRRSGVDPEAVVEPTGVVNGASWSGHERNHYWRNLQGRAFQEQSGISGADVVGDGRTFSLLDFDRDGFQDFVLVSANRPFVQLFRNQQGDSSAAADNHVLAIRLVGGQAGAAADGSWSNRDGIGATIRLRAGELSLSREFRSGEGLSGQNSSTMRIGLGKALFAEGVQIEWPSGKRSSLGRLEADQLLTIFENPEQNGGAAVHVEPLRPAGAGLAISKVHGTDPAAVDGQEGVGLRPLGPVEPLLAELASTSGAPASATRLYVSWFTACAACKRAEPTFRAIRRAFAPEEMAFFGFNNDADDSAAEMAAYAERFQSPYTMLARDQRQIKGYKEIQNRYPPAGWRDQGTAISDQTPSTILTDDEGRVLRTWIGVPSVSELRRTLAGL